MLSHLRVLDCSLNIAGSYCGKLFTDSGADVIKLEPPGGHPLRFRGVKESQTGVLFKFLHQNQRSFEAEYWGNLHAEFNQLLPGVDLLIHSFSAKDLDVDGLLQRFPSLVILSVTPYGREGPYADRPANEFILQAESGALAMRGHTNHPPLMASGQINEWVGGTCAAAAALAACYRASATGEGEHIDYSICETAHMACSNYADLMHSMLGNPPVEAPNRSVEIPEIHECRDGFIGFTANSRQQFEDLLVLIERPDWLGDEGLASYAGRRERRSEFIEAVNAWTQKFTCDEIMEKASALRLPCAIVHNGENILENPQLKAREVFVKDPSGDFLHPRTPWLVHNMELPARAKKPAPLLGEHNDAIESREIQHPEPDGKPGLALDGILVIDMTSWWAGPSASQLLASFGADVIKVESTRRPDGIRMTGGLFAGNYEDWWERSAFFLHANLNKRDLTLDISTEKGLAILKKLLAKADLLVENFTPRVMENFGLNYESVRALNPNIIFVRMPAFGLSGPWRDFPGFAQTMEQMSGMAWLTGHEYDQPHNQRGPSDPNAGMHAAFAAILGLTYRRKTGTALDIETPMIEGALNAAAELVLEYSAHGNLLQRQGNRSNFAAPQNVYACKSEGTESWLAVSVTTDQEWENLKAALGSPNWAKAENLNSHWGRLSRQDSIDENISKWAKDITVQDAVELLIAHKVPAGEVKDARLAGSHPQFLARKYYEEVAHPAVGTHLVTFSAFQVQKHKELDLPPGSYAWPA